MKPSCKANQTYQDELAAAIGLSGDDDDALRHVQHELERYDDILDDEACGSLSAADEDEAVEPVRDEPVRDPRNAVDELCDEEDPIHGVFHARPHLQWLGRRRAVWRAAG